MSGDELGSILGKLKSAPKDFALRKQAAEALEATLAPGAERKQIDAVLEGFVNLTGHDDDAGLPCLCRDCLPRAGVKAESSKLAFYRSFVIAGTRVLHFWMLDEVAGQRANVRDSVGRALVRRLTSRGDQ